MSAGRVGTIYVELDMDRTRFIGAQKAVYDDAVSTSLKIEQNYKSLGIKSAAYFDVLQQRASNAYTMIANKAGESAASQVRAHAAMVAQINATKVDMTQNALFDALGVKSQANIEAQKSALIENYKALKLSGEASAIDLINIKAATTAKLIALDNELNAVEIANDKIRVESERAAAAESLAIREKANQANADYWMGKRAYEKQAAAESLAEQKALGASMAGDVERKLAAEKAIADANQKAIADDKSRWDSLGIRSTAAIKEQMETVKSSAATQQAIYAKGSQDWVNIERAKNDNLKALNKEMVGEHDMSMAAMTRAVLRFYAAWYVASTAIGAVKNFVMGGVDAIDDMKINVISVAAQITSMQGTTGNIVENYKNNVKYAKALVPVLMQVDAASFANLQQINLMNTAAVQHRVILDANNKKQIEGFTAVTNAVALMTTGQDKEKQAAQEIHALTTGRVRESDRVAKSIDNIIKNEGKYKDGLKEVVKLSQEHNDLWERLAPYMVGITAASADISQTWEATSSSMQTVWGMLERDLFKDFYKSLIESGQEAVAYTRQHSTEIVENVKWVVGTIGRGLAVAGGYLIAARLSAMSFAGAYASMSSIIAAANTTMGRSFLAVGVFTLAYEAGKWLNTFKDVQESATIAISEIIGLFNGLEYSLKSIFLKVSDEWANRVSDMKKALAGFLDFTAAGLDYVPGMGGQADALRQYANAIDPIIAKTKTLAEREADLYKEYQRNEEIRKKTTAARLEDINTEIKRPKYSKSYVSAPTIQGGVDQEAIEAAKKAAKDLADIEKKKTEQIQKTIENLKFETEMLSKTADEQYRLNQLKSAGIDINHKMAASVLAAADAYLKEKAAIEQSDEVDWFLKDEKEQSIKNIQENLKSMEEYYKDVPVLASESADKVEGAWVHAAENIIDAWANLFTDLITLQFDGMEEFADGLGKSFASTFSNELVAGVKEGIAVAQKTKTSILDGAMTGAMAGFNPWALAGSVAMTGLSALLADKGPSYGERLADSIDDMVEALKENTQSLRDQLNGTTDLEISIRELTTNIYEKEVGDTGKSLTESFKIPEGMEKRDRTFLDGLKAELAVVFALPTGGTSLTALPQILDKGYTSYDYSPEEASSVMEELASRMGLADFLNMMKETTTNAGALITALKDNALLSGELPQRVLDYYSDGGGSKDDRNRKVAEGVIAQLTEDLLKVGVEAQKIGQSITDFASDWDSRDISEYAKAINEVNDTLGKNKDSAKDFFDALLGGDKPLADRITELTTASGSAGGALDMLIQLTGLTRDEILGLANAEVEYTRILSEKQAYFVSEQQKITNDMVREMDIATGKYSDLEQTYMGIMDKAEAYRVELTNQGMGYEEAATAVTNYANVMKDAAKEVQKAADAAEIKGIIDPAKDVIAQSGMADLEKTIYGITQRYSEQFETLTKLNASAEEFNTLDTAKQIELNAAKDSAYDEIRDFYDTLKEKVSDMLWDLKGGSLAPVQSQEGMNARYQELYQEALKTGDTDKFQSFVTSEFIPFLKGFGNYSEVNAQMITDFTNIGSALNNMADASLGDVTGELSTANVSLSQIYGEMVSLNTTMANITATNGYAAGGYHSGGLRIVGETGIELERTGPSRIYNNQDTISMLQSAISGAVAEAGGKNITVKVYLPNGKEFDGIIAKAIETDTETQYQVKRVATRA